ncbi:M55 family metallopeptidase [Paenibacillus senegalensis]|uniref:M55 family metallopeptidase n=1 Tax=Paenibacillus senegalensis TaxID=1465766 RepID=UPI000288B613|nr:M55 family metallopeptidase [Paenibacillus senegalensis]
MKIFILTDLEGAAGCESFEQTRKGVNPSRKHEVMEQLTREVNACIEGILEVSPKAEIVTWDGHGSGGLLPDKVRGARCLTRENGGRPYYDLEGFSAMLFLGQHAMAGTFQAPLCHTYSSKEIMYYRLNDTFIGEFGCRTLVAGMQGIPVIFISGDDKAIREAQFLIPEIETVITKQGKGIEAAVHIDPEESCRLIRAGAARAVQRIGEFRPFREYSAPYTFEARYYRPFDLAHPKRQDPQLNFLDDRTYQITTNDLADLPF